MISRNVLLGLALVSSASVLGLAQMAPEASAACTVNVGDCRGGDCTANVLASCYDDGNCIVNTALASCSGSGSSCEANVFATCSGGWCDVNVFASCYGSWGERGNCDVNVGSWCRAGGSCLVNVGLADCHKSGSCTVNAALGECSGGCAVNALGPCGTIQILPGSNAKQASDASPADPGDRDPSESTISVSLSSLLETSLEEGDSR